MRWFPSNSTRAVLYCLIHDSAFFGWLSSREKNWLMAYVRPASSDQVEVAYDEACQLYEEAGGFEPPGARVYTIWITCPRLRPRRDNSLTSRRSPI